MRKECHWRKRGRVLSGINSKKIFADRFKFIFFMRLYVIDSIKLQNKSAIEILRFDTQAKDEQFVIPPFCKISKEVTGKLKLVFSYILSLFSR